jgi:signal transduction histidine kinase
VYIKKAIEDLAQMVDDLLDTAKVESGKVSLRLKPFQVQELFVALRGMFRPLVVERPGLQLAFEAGPELPTVISDESKVAQILRNFISNALKNTEQGEIRVSARRLDPRHVILAVTDTGIGIAEEDQSRIFEEFVQLDTIRRELSRGTGLGLSLSKRLAQLLGGRILVKSAIGSGSTFSLILPIARQDDLHAPHKRESTLPFEPILSREGMSQTFPAPPLTEAILDKESDRNNSPIARDITNAKRGLERPRTRSHEVS